MNNKFSVFTIIAFVTLALISCDQKPTQPIQGEVVKNTALNKDGQKIEMTFDNAKGTASVLFEGKTIELTNQNPSSGISYKNDNYLLLGKGDYYEFSKDGNLVFKSDDPFSEDQSNSNGQEWWLDQHLVNSAPISKNPEEGGESFLKIKADSTAEFKNGDIVNIMKWRKENHAILLKDQATERTLKFKITKNTLIDDFGHSWFIKK